MLTKNHSRLLLTLAVVFAAITAQANCSFYIDNQSMNQTDLGKTITLPVKASFDRPISAWEIEFVFPEGLTPLYCDTGSDMNFSYYDDYYGMDKIYTPSLAHNNDLTHFVSTTFGFMPEYYNGDEDRPGSAKWASGEYDEMFLITLRVNDDFQGGEIQIISKATSGYDTRFENGVTPDPDVTGFLYQSDVNQDGMVDVSDITELMNYLVTGSFWSSSNYWEIDGEIIYIGDVTLDGIVNLVDIEALVDYLLFEEHFKGYQCDENTHITTINMYLPMPSLATFMINEYEFSADELGTDVTIPVCAHFEGPIDIWDVQIDFPEGMTPINARQGSDMTLSYEYNGHPSTVTANLFHNNDYTRFSGTPLCAGYYETEYEDYECYGSVKWNSGEYYEMLLLTVHLDESFTGGTIHITSKATYGVDTRGDALVFWPTSMGQDELMNADVNQDGIINISDVWYFLYDLVDHQDGDYIVVNDLTHDGNIDILDVDKIFDYLLFGQWYDGYCLADTEDWWSYIHVETPTPTTGDVNGDSFLNISDVTSLISILLDDNATYTEAADVNHDGYINISDVTDLINILLTMD